MALPAAGHAPVETKGFAVPLHRNESLGRGRFSRGAPFAVEDRKVKLGARMEKRHYKA
jgi:hypothetical protein